MLHSRISLLIHSKGNSLHLLTPDSQSIPLPPPLLPPRQSASLFSKCMSSFRWKGSFGLYMRLLIWVMSYGSRPSLSDFLHSGWEGLVPPMLLQMALGCSVLWRRSIPLCVYTASSLALNCYFPDTILFSTVQRGDPVTHTCRHSMFSHYHAPSNMTRQCTQRYTAGSHC